MNAIDKLSFFINEINDIKDTSLQEFAATLIVNADDYFFTVPASSSGKYHPYFAREENGLVKHTRCVVFYAMCNAESFDFNQHDKDLLIISAIAHDIKKQGDGYKKHTVWEHPEFASNYVLDMQTKYPNLISKNDAKKIANAVLSHMGKWAHHDEFVKKKKKYPMPNNLFEQALQSADYNASRTELTGFAFRDSENVKLPKNILNSFILNEKEIVGNHVFDFGKYKGKTIKEVNQFDRNYLEWMKGKVDFKYKTSREKVIAFLNK